jgi:hypothetical protein
MNFKTVLKITITIICCTAFSIVFAEYLGGRLVPFIDRFYVQTDYWGKIDCFQFECMNGSCLFCLNGNYRSGLVYVENIKNNTLNLTKELNETELVNQDK